MLAPLAKSTKYQGSFRYNCGSTFNNLPKAIRSPESLKTFKTECKRFFKDLISYVDFICIFSNEFYFFLSILCVTLYCQILFLQGSL